MRMEPMQWWMLACLVPGLTGCAAAPPIVTMPAADCAGLVPADWRGGVAGAPLPPEVASAGDWIAFADAQTGRLDQANARTRDALHIVETCEARHAAATARTTRRGLLSRLLR